MSLSSNEINYLIYRYLVESGFSHSAFTFQNESRVTQCTIDPTKIPPGALITFVQKGLQYNELEVNLNEETGDMDGDYEPIPAHELMTNDMEELRKGILERKERHRNALQADPAVKPGQVAVLEGHGNEVFVCAWSPKDNFLASGSGDSTARIWDLTDLSDPRPIVLHHLAQSEAKAKDVTTIDWSGDGSLLATGSYDGLARIWTREGELKHALDMHKGPIFSLKWNRKGNLLLSGSVDKTAIVWDGKTGQMIQQFEHHTAPTLDVDWRNSDEFATCSSDRRILVCRLGECEPLVEFVGHKDEVNAIKWDPSGELLASCSDDTTAKIWRPSDVKPVLDLTEHSKDIYTLKWSPTGPNSPNPNMRLMLATASFDYTGRIWDIPTGKVLQCLAKHTQPVYSIAFSPTGEYVATGSFDKYMHVWSVADGSLVKSYKGNGGIFEVCWNKTGTQVAACFSSKNLAVVDLRM